MAAQYEKKGKEKEGGVFHGFAFLLTVRDPLFWKLRSAKLKESEVNRCFQGGKWSPTIFYPSGYVICARTDRWGYLSHESQSQELASNRL
jgi:hypothetical protein